MTELTCRDCARCYTVTMICNAFNKSVVDNSVHPYECPKFLKRKEVAITAPIFDEPPCDCGSSTCDECNPGWEFENDVEDDDYEPYMDYV